MRIVETFESLQGEGIWLGMPSLFIRVAGCNLTCAYCDTAGARDPAAGCERSVEDLAALAHQSVSRHVVITGGEPTLYGEELVALCATLRRHGKIVTVETNATDFVDCNPHLWSLSPKLDAWPDEALAAYLRCGAPVQIKVVVASAEEAWAALTRLRAQALPAEHTFLMPCARTRAEHAATLTWLAPLCVAEGVRCAVRLQTLLWDNAPGR
jgi:7-carboxy-7-deazaguanine synthase